MTRLSSLLTAALGAAFSLVGQAQAHPVVCIYGEHGRSSFLSGAESADGKVIAGFGLDASGTIVEQILNEETGKFSILVRDPNRTCIMFSGEGWRRVEPGQKGDPS